MVCSMSQVESVGRIHLDFPLNLALLLGSRPTDFVFAREQID